MANLQTNTPYGKQQQQSWASRNKTLLGCGIAVVVAMVLAIFAIVVIAATLWFLPALNDDNGPQEFTAIERTLDNFIIKIDMPKGNGKKQKNIIKGLREIIASSSIANEVGGPVDGDMTKVIEDYMRKWWKYSENYCRNEGAPYAPMGWLTIENIQQNEACATFFVSDGIFVNGGPNGFLRVIRFEDGHVMDQEEMIIIPVEKLAKLAEEYRTDKNTPVPEAITEWGYWFRPENPDTCTLAWEISRYTFREAKIPLAEVDQFLTDEGRKLFKAKPYKLPERPNDAAQEEGNEEYDESYDTNIGLNGSIPEGTSTYAGDMSNFPIELTITKDGDGYRADYRNIRFKATMKLNGESLPADGGDVNFYGKDGQGNDWVFHLTGDANTTITGTAYGDNKQLNITLRRK